MRQVSAWARSGYFLVLDQCPQCGGIWCDRWELYSLDAEQARQIDAVDTARLHDQWHAPAGAGQCPRCTSELTPFSDPAVPPDARIERCPVCDGMWMNRGELARLKSRPGTPRARAVTALTGRLGAAAGWSQVTNLDAATYAHDDPPAAAGDWRDWLRQAGPWLALAVLLRLFLAR